MLLCMELKYFERSSCTSAYVVRMEIDQSDIVEECYVVISQRGESDMLGSPEEFINSIVNAPELEHVDTSTLNFLEHIVISLD